MKTNMKELSAFVKWSVVGDGCVCYYTNNKNACYSITRSPEHADYLENIKAILDNLPDCKTIIKQYKRKDNNKEVLYLRTSSHPLFSRIRDRQYIKGHRVIDPHALTLVDWQHLAYLYQDDGSLTKNIRGSCIVRISTCAYSYPEQEALQKTLLDRFGLIFYINRSGNFYQLNLATKCFQAFFDGIKPFMVPSYAYKFPGSLQKEAPSC